MKAILRHVVTIVLFSSVYSQTSKMYSLKNYTPSAVAENPYSSQWDWENGDVLLDEIPHYWIYFQNRPNAIEEYAAIAPWYQTGAWAGLIDRKKEDGWKLLTRDFGSPSRRLRNDKDNPYFVIYNSSRSIIRVFILMENLIDTYKYSTMELKKYSNGGKETGVLAHLKPISYAMDKVGNMYENATSSVINTLAMKARWVYADFPLAYDTDLIPTENTETPASLQFDVYGTNVDEINLETKGFGAQGDRKFIKAFMENNNFDAPGFSLNTGTLPQLNLDFQLPGVDIKATAPNWKEWLKFLGNFYVDIALPEISFTNPFKDLFDDWGDYLLDLSKLNPSLPVSISGLDINSLYNFFVAGGMKQTNIVQTSPTFFSSHYSSTGTMKSTVKYATLTIPLPAARLNYQSRMLGNPIGLVRNEPVGILTLSKTPVIHKKRFTIASVTQWSQTKYPMDEYELSEIPQIVINPSSGLELKNCLVSLIGPVYWGGFPVNWVIAKAKDATDQKHLIEFEAPINENAANMRSLPVPIQFSVGRNLQLPPEIPPSEIKLKIKATLQRKDDPNAQPVVFVATYNVDVVATSGLAEQALPTIPPQNVICIIPQTGGVRISWDRNLEKNIKLYAIERNINGGTYSQIGTTPDTLFVDNEVQRAVKPYQANRKNVSVNYRVRALSEWTEPSIWPGANGTQYSQYSNYSNAININGSMGILIEKHSSDFTIIPESDSISQNFPNPFNPATTIYYSVREEGIVTLKIYNSLGQEIATLLNERKEVGYHYAEWNASQYPSGIYYYRIANGTFTETKRMVLAK